MLSRVSARWELYLPFPSRRVLCFVVLGIMNQFSLSYASHRVSFLYIFYTLCSSLSRRYIAVIIKTPLYLINT